MMSDAFNWISGLVLFVLFVAAMLSLLFSLRQPTIEYVSSEKFKRNEARFTIIPEDTEIRPASCSYVKPSEMADIITHSNDLRSVILVYSAEE